MCPRLTDRIFCRTFFFLYPACARLSLARSPHFLRRALKDDSLDSRAGLLGVSCGGRASPRRRRCGPEGLPRCVHPSHLSCFHPPVGSSPQVTAPDGVVGPVVYSMEGPEINSYNGRPEDRKFSINTTTGKFDDDWV